MRIKALYEGIFIMTIHVVKPGDTLAGIADTYGVSQNLLAIWNALSDPYALVVGQAILILTPAGLYTVRARRYSSLYCETLRDFSKRAFCQQSKSRRRIGSDL